MGDIPKNNKRACPCIRRIFYMKRTNLIREPCKKGRCFIHVDNHRSRIFSNSHDSYSIFIKNLVSNISSCLGSFWLTDLRPKSDSLCQMNNSTQLFIYKVYRKNQQGFVRVTMLAMNNSTQPWLSLNGALYG